MHRGAISPGEGDAIIAQGEAKFPQGSASDRCHSLHPGLQHLETVAVFRSGGELKFVEKLGLVSTHKRQNLFQLLGPLLQLRSGLNCVIACPSFRVWGPRSF